MLFGTGGTVSLSVTSRLMSARLCSRKAESVYDVRCCKTREYDGFAGGEFVDAEAAGALAKELLTAAAEETRPRTKTVYVGVPGEFGMSVCRDVSVMLDRSRRIVDADTAYLAEKGRGAAESSRERTTLPCSRLRVRRRDLRMSGSSSSPGRSA